MAWFNRLPDDRVTETRRYTKDEMNKEIEKIRKTKQPLPEDVSFFWCVTGWFEQPLINFIKKTEGNNEDTK